MHASIRQSRPTDPPWLPIAFGELGQREIIGDRDNPRIVQYHQSTSLRATDDETPWCSSFLCWVFEQSGLTATDSAASLSWLRWGREIQTPRRGCVVIFERLSTDGRVIPNRGHCGIWLGVESDSTVVLGGNQSNVVGVNAMPTDRVIGYRWPALPYNSTTNIASAGVGVATLAGTVPTVLEVLHKLDDNKDTVTTVVGQVRGVLDAVLSDPNASLTIGAAVTVVVCALWIGRERNKKIRRWGI